MRIEDLKQQAGTERTRARSLKTKAAQRKAYDRVRSLENEAWRLLHDEASKHGLMSFKGTVISNQYRDDIGVKTAFGTFWISPTCDVLSKSWYPSTCCMIYDKGQEVIIEATVEVDFDRLSLYLAPKRIYGGRLDAEKYAELDKRDDLAFFKHSSGGMTGLFKRGVS